MKTLYVVRHAKAGSHSESRDFERELTGTGRLEAAATGKGMDARTISVDLVLTSPAARAWETAKIIAEEIGYATASIATDRRIYNAEDRMMLKILQQIKDEYHTVILVGHNPGLTEFANGVFSALITSMSTGSVAYGQLNIEAWKDARWGCGELDDYQEPT